jgi:hypothetical protein
VRRIVSVIYVSIVTGVPTVVFAINFGDDEIDISSEEATPELDAACLTSICEICIYLLIVVWVTPSGPGRL